jgi:hypothetical protein
MRKTIYIETILCNKLLYDIYHLDPMAHPTAPGSNHAVNQAQPGPRPATVPGACWNPANGSEGGVPVCVETGSFLQFPLLSCS